MIFSGDSQVNSLRRSERDGKLQNPIFRILMMPVFDKY
jgi:hypothetical protein